MSLILSIETATGVCSTAIHENDNCLVEQINTVKKSHSEKLPELIQTTLEKAGKDFDDLSAIAVSKGPGSYTGLRIGVSTAKGIAFAYNLPLIGINTLMAMAHHGAQLTKDDEYICPMIDARRSEVYCLVTNHDLELIWETQALIVNENSFQNLSAGNTIVFLGDGSEKFRDLWDKTDRMRHIPDILPSARYIGSLAREKFIKNEFENLAEFEPYYLKDFRAGISKKIIPL